MIKEIEYNLKQITPMFHFKYGKVNGDKQNTEKYDKLQQNIKKYNDRHQLSMDLGEGLRATELKPRFISYLKEVTSDKSSIFKKIDEQFDNKDKWIGDSNYLEHNIKIFVTQLKPTVDSKQKNEGVVKLANQNIKALSETDGLKDNFITFEKTKVILQLRVNDKWNKDWANGNLLSEQEEEIITTQFILFIETHCFGKRSKKGFGSFTVENTLPEINYSNPDIYDENNCNVFEKNIKKGEFTGIEQLALNIKSRKKLKKMTANNFSLKIDDSKNNKEKIDHVSLVKILLGSTDSKKHLGYKNYFNGLNVDKIPAPYMIKPVSDTKLLIIIDYDRLKKNFDYVKDYGKQGEKFLGDLKAESDKILEVTKDSLEEVIRHAKMKNTKQNSLNKSYNSKGRK